jgi:hypothetical protein
MKTLALKETMGSLGKQIDTLELPASGLLNQILRYGCAKRFAACTQLNRQRAK